MANEYKEQGLIITEDEREAQVEGEQEKIEEFNEDYVFVGNEEERELLKETDLVDWLDAANDLKDKGAFVAAEKVFDINDYVFTSKASDKQKKKLQNSEGKEFWEIASKYRNKGLIISSEELKAKEQEKKDRYQSIVDEYGIDSGGAYKFNGIVYKGQKSDIAYHLDRLLGPGGRIAHALERVEKDKKQVKNWQRTYNKLKKYKRKGWYVSKKEWNNVEKSLKSKKNILEKSREKLQKLREKRDELRWALTYAPGGTEMVSDGQLIEYDVSSDGSVKLERYLNMPEKKIQPKQEEQSASEIFQETMAALEEFQQATNDWLAQENLKELERKSFKEYSNNYIYDNSKLVNKEKPTTEEIYKAGLEGKFYNPFTENYQQMPQEVEMEYDDSEIVSETKFDGKGDKVAEYSFGPQPIANPGPTTKQKKKDDGGIFSSVGNFLSDTAKEIVSLGKAETETYNVSDESQLAAQANPYVGRNENESSYTVSQKTGDILKEIISFGQTDTITYNGVTTQIKYDDENNKIKIQTQYDENYNPKERKETVYNPDGEKIGYEELDIQEDRCAIVIDIDRDSTMANDREAGISTVIKHTGLDSLESDKYINIVQEEGVETIREPLTRDESIAIYVSRDYLESTGRYEGEFTKDSSGEILSETNVIDYSKLGDDKNSSTTHTSKNGQDIVHTKNFDDDELTSQQLTDILDTESKTIIDDNVEEIGEEKIKVTEYCEMSDSQKKEYINSFGKGNLEKAEWYTKAEQLYKGDTLTDIQGNDIEKSVAIDNEKVGNEVTYIVDNTDYVTGEETVSVENYTYDNKLAEDETAFKVEDSEGETFYVVPNNSEDGIEFSLEDKEIVGRDSVSVYDHEVEDSDYIKETIHSNENEVWTHYQTEYYNNGQILLDEISEVGFEYKFDENGNPIKIKPEQGEGTGEEPPEHIYISKAKEILDNGIDSVKYKKDPGSMFTMEFNDEDYLSKEYIRDFTNATYSPVDTERNTVSVFNPDGSHSVSKNVDFSDITCLTGSYTLDDDPENNSVIREITKDRSVTGYASYSDLKDIRSDYVLEKEGKWRIDEGEYRYVTGDLTFNKGLFFNKIDSINSDFKINKKGKATIIAADGRYLTHDAELSDADNFATTEYDIEEEGEATIFVGRGRFLTHDSVLDNPDNFGETEYDITEEGEATVVVNNERFLTHTSKLTYINDFANTGYEVTEEGEATIIIFDEENGQVFSTHNSKLDNPKDFADTTYTVEKEGKATGILVESEEDIRYLNHDSELDNPDNFAETEYDISEEGKLVIDKGNNRNISFDSVLDEGSDFKDKSFNLKDNKGVANILVNEKKLIEFGAVIGDDEDFINAEPIINENGHAMVFGENGEIAIFGAKLDNAKDFAKTDYSVNKYGEAGNMKGGQFSDVIKAELDNENNFAESGYSKIEEYSYNYALDKDNYNWKDTGGGYKVGINKENNNKVILDSEGYYINPNLPIPEELEITVEGDKVIATTQEGDRIEFIQENGVFSVNKIIDKDHMSGWGFRWKFWNHNQGTKEVDKVEVKTIDDVGEEKIYEFVTYDLSEQKGEVGLLEQSRVNTYWTVDFEVANKITTNGAQTEVADTREATTEEKIDLMNQLNLEDRSKLAAHFIMKDFNHKYSGYDELYKGDVWNPDQGNYGVFTTDASKGWINMGLKWLSKKEGDDEWEEYLNKNIEEGIEAGVSREILAAASDAGWDSDNWFAKHIEGFQAVKALGGGYDNEYSSWAKEFKERVENGDIEMEGSVIVSARQEKYTNMDMGFDAVLAASMVAGAGAGSVGLVSLRTGLSSLKGTMYTARLGGYGSKLPTLFSGSSKGSRFVTYTRGSRFAKMTPELKIGKGIKFKTRAHNFYKGSPKLEPVRKGIELAKNGKTRAHNFYTKPPKPVSKAADTFRSGKGFVSRKYRGVKDTLQPLKDSMQPVTNAWNRIPERYVTLKHMNVGGVVHVVADEIKSLATTGEFLSPEEILNSYKSGALTGGVASLGLRAGGIALRAAGFGSKLQNAVLHTDRGILQRLGNWPLNAGKKMVDFSKNPASIPISFGNVARLTSVGPMFTSVDIVWESAKHGELSWQGKEYGLSLEAYYAVSGSDFAKMGIYLPSLLGTFQAPWQFYGVTQAQAAAAGGHSMTTFLKVIRNWRNKEALRAMIAEGGAKHSAGFMGGGALGTLNSAVFITTSLQVGTKVGLMAGLDEEQAHYVGFAVLFFAPVEGMTPGAVNNYFVEKGINQKQIFGKDKAGKRNFDENSEKSFYDQLYEKNPNAAKDLPVFMHGKSVKEVQQILNTEIALSLDYSKFDGIKSTNKKVENLLKEGHGLKGVENLRLSDLDPNAYGYRYYIETKNAEELYSILKGADKEGRTYTYNGEEKPYIFGKNQAKTLASTVLVQKMSAENIADIVLKKEGPVTVEEIGKNNEVIKRVEIEAEKFPELYKSAVGQFCLLHSAGNKIIRDMIKDRPEQVRQQLETLASNSKGEVFSRLAKTQQLYENLEPIKEKPESKKSKIETKHEKQWNKAYETLGKAIDNYWRNPIDRNFNKLNEAVYNIYTQAHSLFIYSALKGKNPKFTDLVIEKLDNGDVIIKEGKVKIGNEKEIELKNRQLTEEEKMFLRSIEEARNIDQLDNLQVDKIKELDGIELDGTLSMPGAKSKELLDKIEQDSVIISKVLKRNNVEIENLKIDKDLNIIEGTLYAGREKIDLKNHKLSAEELNILRRMEHDGSKYNLGKIFVADNIKKAGRIEINGKLSMSESATNRLLDEVKYVFLKRNNVKIENLKINGDLKVESGILHIGKREINLKDKKLTVEELNILRQMELQGKLSSEKLMGLNTGDEIKIKELSMSESRRKELAENYINWKTHKHVFETFSETKFKTEKIGRLSEYIVVEKNEKGEENFKLDEKKLKNVEENIKKEAGKLTKEAGELTKELNDIAETYTEVMREKIKPTKQLSVIMRMLRHKNIAKTHTEEMKKIKPWSLKTKEVEGISQRGFLLKMLKPDSLLELGTGAGKTSVLSPMLNIFLVNRGIKVTNIFPDGQKMNAAVKYYKEGVAEVLQKLENKKIKVTTVTEEKVQTKSNEKLAKEIEESDIVLTTQGAAKSLLMSADQGNKAAFDALISKRHSTFDESHALPDLPNLIVGKLSNKLEYANYDVYKVMKEIDEYFIKKYGLEKIAELRKQCINQGKKIDIDTIDTYAKEFAKNKLGIEFNDFKKSKDSNYEKYREGLRVYFKTFESVQNRDWDIVERMPDKIFPVSENQVASHMRFGDPYQAAAYQLLCYRFVRIEKPELFTGKELLDTTQLLDKVETNPKSIAETIWGVLARSPSKTFFTATPMGVKDAYIAGLELRASELSQPFKIYEKGGARHNELKDVRFSEIEKIEDNIGKIIEGKKEKGDPIENQQQNKEKHIVVLAESGRVNRFHYEDTIKALGEKYGFKDVYILRGKEVHKLKGNSFVEYEGKGKKSFDEIALKSNPKDGKNLILVDKGNIEGRDMKLRFKEKTAEDAVFIGIVDGKTTKTLAEQLLGRDRGKNDKYLLFLGREGEYRDFNELDLGKKVEKIAEIFENAEVKAINNRKFEVLTSILGETMTNRFRILRDKALTTAEIEAIDRARTEFQSKSEHTGNLYEGEKNQIALDALKTEINRLKNSFEENIKSEWNNLGKMNKNLAENYIRRDKTVELSLQEGKTGEWGQMGLVRMDFTDAVKIMNRYFKEKDFQYELDRKKPANTVENQATASVLNEAKIGEKGKSKSKIKEDLITTFENRGLSKQEAKQYTIMIFSIIPSEIFSSNKINEQGEEYFKILEQVIVNFDLSNANILDAIIKANVAYNLNKVVGNNKDIVDKKEEIKNIIYSNKNINKEPGQIAGILISAGLFTQESSINELLEDIKNKPDNINNIIGKAEEIGDKDKKLLKDIFLLDLDFDKIAQLELADKIEIAGEIKDIVIAPIEAGKVLVKKITINDETVGELKIEEKEDYLEINSITVSDEVIGAKVINLIGNYAKEKGFGLKITDIKEKDEPYKKIAEEEFELPAEEINEQLAQNEIKLFEPFETSGRIDDYEQEIEEQFKEKEKLKKSLEEKEKEKEDFDREWRKAGGNELNKIETLRSEEDKRKIKETEQERTQIEEEMDKIDGEIKKIEKQIEEKNKEILPLTQKILTSYVNELEEQIPETKGEKEIKIIKELIKIVNAAISESETKGKVDKYVVSRLAEGLEFEELPESEKQRLKHIIEKSAGAEIILPAKSTIVLGDVVIAKRENPEVKGVDIVTEVCEAGFTFEGDTKNPKVVVRSVLPKTSSKFEVVFKNGERETLTPDVMFKEYGEVEFNWKEESVRKGKEIESVFLIERIDDYEQEIEEQYKGIENIRNLVFIEDKGGSQFDVYEGIDEDGKDVVVKVLKDHKIGPINLGPIYYFDKEMARKGYDIARNEMNDYCGVIDVKDKATLNTVNGPKEVEGLVVVQRKAIPLEHKINDAVIKGNMENMNDAMDLIGQYVYIMNKMNEMGFRDIDLYGNEFTKEFGVIGERDVIMLDPGMLTRTSDRDVTSILGISASKIYNSLYNKFKVARDPFIELAYKANKEDINLLRDRYLDLSAYLNYALENPEVTTKRFKEIENNLLIKVKDEIIVEDFKQGLNIIKGHEVSYDEGKNILKIDMDTYMDLVALYSFSEQMAVENVRILLAYAQARDKEEFKQEFYKGYKEFTQLDFEGHEITDAEEAMKAAIAHALLCKFVMSSEKDLEKFIYEKRLGVNPDSEIGKEILEYANRFNADLRIVKPKPTGVMQAESTKEQESKKQKSGIQQFAEVLKSVANMELRRIAGIPNTLSTMISTSDKQKFASYAFIADKEEGGYTSYIEMLTKNLFGVKREQEKSLIPDINKFMKVLGSA
ncbi:MAG: hypothetical protein ACOC5T_00645 [Elusimicrobiota bacterium]